LAELRLTLKKINQILDNTHSLSPNIVTQATAVKDLFAEVRDTIADTPAEKIPQDIPDKVLTASSPRLSQRSFFRRSGIPLRAS
jgi:hypothetical protein